MILLRAIPKPGTRRLQGEEGGVGEVADSEIVGGGEAREGKRYSTSRSCPPPLPQPAALSAAPRARAHSPIVASHDILARVVFFTIKR